MKKIQIFEDDQWRFVFCRNQYQAKVITTEDRSKALPQRAAFRQQTIDYFQRHFPDRQFRIEP